MTTSSGNPIHDPRPSSSTSGETATADAAKAQAGDVVSGATDAGKHVASVAGDQASQVAGEATTEEPVETEGEETANDAIQLSQERYAELSAAEDLARAGVDRYRATNPVGHVCGDADSSSPAVARMRR